MSDWGDTIIDLVRRSGVEHLSGGDRARLCCHLASQSARVRARVRHRLGDAIAEREIDEVWEAIGGEPTADDYEEIARLMDEAAAYCRARATERRGR